jgi:hypothetical protein
MRSMAGQGSSGFSFLLAVVVLLFTEGVGAGLVAVVDDRSWLWRTADLFFDLALVITMVSRGPSLIQRMNGRAQ